MNIFEGSRRLTYIAYSIIILVAIFVSITEKPHVSLTYFTPSPIDKFTQRLKYDAEKKELIEEKCEKWDKSHIVYKKVSDIITAHITLCFKAVSAKSNTNNDAMLIPFFVNDKKMVSLNTPYSQIVEDYVLGRAQKFEVEFELDETMIEKLKKEYRYKKFISAKRNMVFAIKTCFCLFLFSLFTGWIVRGFMSKPDL